MSIQFMDNFGSYGIGGGSVGYMLNGLPYTSVLNGADVDPADPSGVCWNITSNTGLGRCATIVPVPVNALGFTMRWYSSGGGQRMPFVWVDGGGQALYALVVEINGALSLYQCDYDFGQQLGTRVATTTIPVLTYNSWWHLEAMLDYSLGAFQVFVEGVSVLSFSFTADSGTLIYNTALAVSTYGNAYSGTVFVKDFVLYDKSGTVNNTVGSIGPCTVYRLALDSDVSNGWTIVGGTTVNGTIGVEPPNDANYISAGVGPLPAGAVCGISPLPSNIVGVRGVMSLQRVQKSDGGDANYKIDLISGGSTHTGTAHVVSTSFNYQYDIIELDPATGEVWSPIAVNNMNIEIDRTV